VVINFNVEQATLPISRKPKSDVNGHLASHLWGASMVNQPQKQKILTIGGENKQNKEPQPGIEIRNGNHPISDGKPARWNSFWTLSWFIFIRPECWIISFQACDPKHLKLLLFFFAGLFKPSPIIIYGKFNHLGKRKVIRFAFSDFFRQDLIFESICRAGCMKCSTSWQKGSSLGLTWKAFCCEWGQGENLAPISSALSSGVFVQALPVVRLPLEWIYCYV